MKKTQKERKKDRCAYCGVIANTRDHVVPKSFFFSRSKQFALHKSINNIVKACSECNNIASNKVFLNFWEKKQYIAEKFYCKNKKLLNGVDWTESEIEELEGLLKIAIGSNKHKKERAKIRYENLQTQEIIE